MEELQNRNLQMTGLTEKITKYMTGLNKSKRVALDIAEIQQRLHEFEIAWTSSYMELSHIHEDTQKRDMKMMLRGHKRQLKLLASEFEEKRAQVVKSQLLADHKAGPNGLTTADGLMAHGLQVQDQSTASLKRTLDTIHQAADIGRSTNDKLAIQIDQMARIDDQVENVGTTLDRSQTVIKRIGRKIATDKYICCIIS